jgi:cytochrome c oxidase subunit 1
MTKKLDLTIPTGKTATLVKYWLILAISSLAAAGLYSLAPVILRGPFFADKFDVEHIFATALVVHVDLSVLVWFLSIGGVLWSFLASKKQFWIYKISFILAAIGTAIIALSPFIGDSNPLKNNYVPVLQNAAFFIGLSLFACGMIFQTVLTIANYKKAKESVLNAGIYMTAVITLIAGICFVIAHNITPIPSDDDFHQYYESIFRGGGHVLQYTFTTCMIIVWVWLANLCGIRQILSNKQTFALLAFNLALTLPSPLFYMTDITTHLFTQQMRHGGGISALFIGGAILFAAFFAKKEKVNHSIKAALILSIILFGYGGLLAYMISGVNVTIPAHYHGSIVAVTLAFIGLAYHLLPKLGFAKIKGKMATSQPYIYGVGQIMHITGLAWMGGYGALRKSAASSHEIINIAPKIMFFSGGVLAIIGGLLFIIVAARSILKK